MIKREKYQFVNYFKTLRTSISELSLRLLSVIIISLKVVDKTKIFFASLGG